MQPVSQAFFYRIERAFDVVGCVPYEGRHAEVAVLPAVRIDVLGLQSFAEGPSVFYFEDQHRASALSIARRANG